MPETLTPLEWAVLERLRGMQPYSRIEIKWVSEGRVSIVTTSTLKEDFPL